MASESTVESYSLAGRHVSQIHSQRTNRGAVWYDGAVLFPEGMVIVMISPEDGYTRFDTVVGGRHYIRTEHRTLSQRGAVTVARRWIRSLAPATDHAADAMAGEPEREEE